MNKSIPALMLIGLVLCFAVQPSFAQDCPDVKPVNLMIPESALDSKKNDDIIEQTVSIHVTNVPLSRIVYRLAYDFGIKFGFEAAPIDRDHESYDFEPYLFVTRGRISRCHPAELSDGGAHGLTLEANNQKLRVVLDDLVRQMENYRWDVRDGIVNIYPKAERDPTIVALLELKITRFRFKADRKIVHVFEDLLGTPEFVEFKKSNNIEIARNRPTIIGEGMDYILKDDIEFQQLTVGELLNKLGKLNKVGWIVKSRRGKDNGQLIIMGI